MYCKIGYGKITQSSKLFPFKGRIDCSNCKVKADLIEDSVAYLICDSNNAYYLSLSETTKEGIARILEGEYQ